MLALLTVTLVTIVYTRDWADPSRLRKSTLPVPKHASDLADTRLVETAQQMAFLAVTPEEQDYAQEALRLADLSVGIGFAAALRDAAESPTPLTPETREVSSRVREAKARVAADEERVARLSQQLAKARGNEKDNLQQDVDLAQEQLALDKEEFRDTHEDLVRAGGDRHATIQLLLDQYKASTLHAGTTRSGTAPNASVEATTSASVVAQGRAWNSLHSKEQLLRQTQKSVLASAAKLTSMRDVLAQEVQEEKSQNKVVHEKGSGTPLAGNAQAASAPNGTTNPLSFVRHLAHDQKDLSDLGKCIEEDQELAGVYANWTALVTARQRFFVHGLLQRLFLIVVIALLVFLANYGIHRFFSDLTPERRRLHMMRALLLFSLQAVGVVLILLLLFGTPNNFATVVALAGAGLTVALKDFIVGFFGWFVLVGKNGIHPGDWVEIEGVGGEVLEVGLLHTVLLETGNWSDAGHPTGRKVTFVNSFAIEGHYFNFSTSGQWLWDEIQIALPENSDPFAIAETIQKIVTDETAANARLAEQEWERVTPAHAKRSFSAAPSMNVRPTATGVNVLVRYIARASERNDVRARLYRALVELLHRKNISEPVLATPPSQSVADRS